MRRREFFGVLGATAAWPLAARAQQQAMPAIGFLRSTPAASFAHLLAAFRDGLKGEGFEDGRNVAIEERYADNQLDRLPGLVVDLMRRQVATIIANSMAAEAARAATKTTPIVFVTGDDPVRNGLVTSLSRPGGNLTGITFFGGGVLGAKRVELLRDLVPNAMVIAVLTDPNYGGSEAEMPAIEAAGRSLARQIVNVKAASERELGPAFAGIVGAGALALLVGGGATQTSFRRQIVALAARHKLPAMYSNRDYVVAGGLISYAASIIGAYRQAGIYAGKILRGANPGDLPVLQPTTFELAINAKTAKALGLEIPPSIMLRADEVID
jgi:putative ABC transport system substrate-binding protein